MKCRGCGRNWALRGFTACRRCRALALKSRGYGARAVAVAVRVFGRLRVVGECWEFEGTPHGVYAGDISIDGRKQSVYRWALILAAGEPPAGHEADHSCHNGLCCRPEHLRWATVYDNRTRAIRHLTPDARRLAHNAYQRKYQREKRIEGRAVGKIRTTGGAWVFPRSPSELRAIVDGALARAGAVSPPSLSLIE